MCFCGMAALATMRSTQTTIVVEEARLQCRPLDLSELHFIERVAEEIMPV